MWRHIVIIFFAAAVGSVAATTLLDSLAGPAGDPNPPKVVMGFSAASMIFSVPGAMMLVGIKAIITNRRWPAFIVGIIVLAIGAIVGAAILALISGGHFKSTAIGRP